MKRLLPLCVLAFAAPLAWAGAPASVTIFTDRVPPYLVPLAGSSVPVGSTANASVTLSNGLNGSAQITILSNAPGTDFAITGGTCAVGTVLAAPGSSCSIDVSFTPTAASTSTRSI